MAHSFKNLKIRSESVIDTFFLKAYGCVNSTPVPLRMLAPAVPLLLLAPARADKTPLFL